MSYSLVSSSVSANAYVTTFNLKNTHKKNATEDDALSIGNLAQECVNISISAEASATAAVTNTTITANPGVIKLTTEIFDSRFELLDSQGNIIASNMGTEEQLAAFQEWKNGTLVVDGGTYTITATPAAVVRGEAPPEGDGGVFEITNTETQGTTLAVDCKLTGNNQSEYYNYYFSGNSMKLDFSTQTKTHNTARVVIYNSSGAVVADSQGTTYQRQKYLDLTSSAGLSATTGNYTIKVTYGKNANNTEDLKYSFQMYAGNSYSVVYKNKVTANAYDGTAAGSVTATDDALLFETNKFHKIGSKATEAINIGWMQKDKSMLDVFSMLTPANNQEYYSFTLQEGDNLKFGFSKKNNTNVDALRIQIMDGTGSFVFADSEGTKEQREAYEKLTTANGMDIKTGTYVVKISYSGNAKSLKDVTYEFGLYSGTSYAAQYKTIASAQTYANALLNGSAIGSTSRSSAIAAYLDKWSTGDSDLASSISSALQKKI